MISEPPPYYDWLHFASRTGEPGSEWAAIYRGHQTTVDLSNQALELLRRGRSDDGLAALGEYQEAIEALDPCPPSMKAICRRWYHGVIAYHFYRVEDFDRAEESIRAAQEAVIDAVSIDAFLFLVAIHCKEFCLHQARIARNRRRWAEMNASIDRALAMVTGQAPLCRTHDGREIDFSTIAEVLRLIQPISDGEREAVRGFVNERERMRLFDRFVRALDGVPELDPTIRHS